MLFYAQTPAAVGVSQVAPRGTAAGARCRPYLLTRGAAIKPKILFLLDLLLLAACAAPAADLAPTPTPTLLPPIPANHHGLLYIELPPGGTPEADPMVTFTATILDSTTGAPVVAMVYLFDDLSGRPLQQVVRLRANVTGFVVKLPAVYSGHLIVQAAGYQDWNVVLQHRVKTSRVIEGPVWLVPVTALEI